MRLGALGNVVGNSWERVRALAAGRLGALGASGCALGASGCVWVRLGAPGSACGRLGSAWRLVPPRSAWVLLERLGELGESHASGAAWGAPEAAWERLCVPRALGASGSAWGRLRPLAERLGPSGSAWALLERRWGAHGSVGGADLFYDGSRPRGRRTCAFSQGSISFANVWPSAANVLKVKY